MKEEILKLAGRHLEEATALRHELHKIPEIAGKEFKTSALLRKRLEALPLKVLDPFLETDVVALLNDSRPGCNVTLRADIDALPVTEENTSDHVSTHPGMMHACGHDGHMAMLYGAARILCDLRDRLPGSVRILFQPGEEVAALAKPLIEAGAVDVPKMDFCAALHGWPNVKYNCISTRTGAVMAAAGFFYLTVTGRGGHGSMPSKALNPINVIARIVDALRKECPGEGVCTVCHIDGGSNTNIIPATVKIEGTVRFLKDGVGREIETVFRSVVERICKEEGATWELDYTVTYPVTASSAEGAELAKAVTEKYFGNGRFVPMKESSMSSEDFSYFLRKSSGVFCHLGLGEHTALHNSRFEFDDKVLKTGMIFLAGIAADYLTAHNR